MVGEGRCQTIQPSTASSKHLHSAHAVEKYILALQTLSVLVNRVKKAVSQIFLTWKIHLSPCFPILRGQLSWQPIRTPPLAHPANISGGNWPSSGSSGPTFRDHLVCRSFVCYLPLFPSI